MLQGSKSITCQRVTETLAAWSDHRPICRGELGWSRLPRFSSLIAEYTKEIQMQSTVYRQQNLVMIYAFVVMLVNKKFFF